MLLAMRLFLSSHVSAVMVMQYFLTLTQFFCKQSAVFIRNYSIGCYFRIRLAK